MVTGTYEGTFDLASLEGQENSSLLRLEGTLQRVNYAKKEFNVVAQGRIWRFALAPDAQMWFENQRTILRCFHSLDKVVVLFREDHAGNHVAALYAWEQTA